MKTGFRGAYVICWSQTEIDGLEDAPRDALSIGSAWSWRGEVLRVDGPTDVLQLDRAEEADALRQRAARKVHRLVGLTAPSAPRVDLEEEKASARDSWFVLTDGARVFTATVIDALQGSVPLLMFVDELPPRNTDMWVVRQVRQEKARPAPAAIPSGMICFTPGTFITTPFGQRPIETLREGDRILTRDNGPQEILWVGSRRMSGARLRAMPQLRPVRLRVGALGIDRPDRELLVSPDHRLLLKSRRAKSAFDEAEVLVAARDLVNDKSITVDHAAREVTYIHLLLARHEVIAANGVLAESFHPASASFGALDERDLGRLLGLYPQLDADPFSYGAFARRRLSSSEAAILNLAA